MKTLIKEETTMSTKILRKLSALKMGKFLSKRIGLIVLSCILSIASFAQDYSTLNADVNIRKGPGTNYESYGLLPKGGHVLVLETLSSGWSRVKFNTYDDDGEPMELFGYVSSKFINRVATKKQEDYTTLPKVELYGTGERSTIGCDNIMPKYNFDNDCSLLINATTADYDTVLKICDLFTDNCIRMVYVRRGTSFEVKNIPFGTYYLKTASGEDLRKKVAKNGNCILVFAKNASYRKTETTFRFYREYVSGGYTDVGWEYILQRRVAMKDTDTVATDVISPDEFNE